MLPQSVREGAATRKVARRTGRSAVADGRAASAAEHLGRAGCCPETAKMITAIQIQLSNRVRKDCDGQSLCHDLIGLFPWFTPKFVAPGELAARSAGARFVARTANG